MHTFWKEIRLKRAYYLMALPGLLFFLVFCYFPMFGILLAFKDFNVRDGILGSPWVGWKNFEFFFTSDKAWSTTANTLLFNGLFIISGLIFQIGIAILLNEIRGKLVKKLFQSSMFFPYFISWVVVGGLVTQIFGTDFGVVNHLLESIGADPIKWYQSPQYWIPILVGIHVWKSTGYGVIIYLATIVSVDSELYEAAKIDGANRFQQIRYIMLPFLAQTATILTLLAIGRVFYGDFGMMYAIIGDNGMLTDRTDVIDTYVFRALRTNGDFGMTTAIGLYQSVVGLILVLVSNGIVRKYQRENALF
ncbi:ABC transporter permease [Paenibacillaceae bacterium WGS1546]|uniref:ABC transporter permease n=1 Tax=Cohnella sp. WGS1546 TaxID=3366810 RepID=UPI00372D5766